MPTDRRLPLPLKLGFTAWTVLWFVVYWRAYGLLNFLWFCNLANLLVAVALWSENALVLSSQAQSVFLVQLGWALDFFGRLASGQHWIGGTEYMFDATKPLFLRSFSLYHLAMPAIFLFAISRLGYDRRAFRAQTLFAWGVLLVSYFATSISENVNWVHGPFGKIQTWMPPLAWLGVCLVLYPALLYWPSHRALAWWSERASNGR